MITLATLYWFAGLVFASFALLDLTDRSNPKRYGNAGFWGLLALSMVAGDYVGDVGNGVIVLCLVGIAGTGQMGRGVANIDTAAQTDAAARYGNRLFLLALVIPAVALAGTFAFKQWPGFADPKQVTLIALCLGVILALVTGVIWLRARPTVPFDAGRQLADSVGWAAILPQMLASLGAIFALAGVGEVVGNLLGNTIPDGSILGATIVFGVGMALFTMVMGNAFAAFPVMLAAIGLPLLIRTYGGDPAVVCAIGMLAGFCGTLMTPMAANFNIVPAALLELSDRNAVIKAQVGTAVPLLFVNIALIYWLAFP